MSISTKWLQWDHTAEERAKTEISIRNSALTLALLQKILTKELELLDKNKMEDYALAAWPYLQADRNGQVRAIKQLLELVTLVPIKKDLT